MKEILIQNVFGDFQIFLSISHAISSFYRHIEISSHVANQKFVFTTVPYGSMSQGKIGFNTLQVRLFKIFQSKKQFVDIISGDGLE